MNDGKRGGRRTHPYSVERERERIRDWGADELKTGVGRFRPSEGTTLWRSTLRIPHPKTSLLELSAGAPASIEFFFIVIIIIIYEEA